MAFHFDAVLVMGKELRRDPERARRELRARAAAASAAVRAGASFVASLEAKLAGQDESGCDLMFDLLRELGVPEAAIVRASLTRSTREEAVLGTSLFEERGVQRGLVLTARYHVPRTRRLFREAHAPAEVHAPEGLWRWANERERAWIREGEPDAAAMGAEGRTEALFSLLEGALRPLPVALAGMIEIRAGAWLRG
ncbi:hypothetical protein LBMAG42_51020 [Deltaproteobacteria bacterium]|nr:hypothetical protein LBMAG42_51020 [Deltaproteobacteria bacterium]